MLVCVVFFSDISLTVLSTSFLSIGYVIDLFGALIKRVIPATLLIWYEQWKLRGRYNSLIVGLLPFPTGAALIWWTLNWSSPFGGLMRCVLLICMVHLAPVGLVATAMQLGILAVALPLHAFNKFCALLSKRQTNSKTQ